MKKDKVLFIVGQTSTGKSDLAVFLAKKFNGEIISADSRQVYKGFDLGAGKITKSEMKGVPHYLLDVASPKRTFSVEQYKRLADKKIFEILKRNKLPIVIGGTGMYIDAILYNQNFPSVKPNNKLRKELEKKPPEELFGILKKLDKKRANDIEEKNPRRLIRAIEIANEIGKTPKLEREERFDSMILGLALPEKELRDRINKRLLSRIKKGMIKEVKNLHETERLSWARLEKFGLEYRYTAQFLQKKITREEMLEKINTKSWQYSKRQKTWFKKNNRILWINPKDYKKAEGLVKKKIGTV